MRTNTEPLVTRPLLVRFVSTVGSTASFYLLLSAVPEYVRSAGADAGTAGLATTALTLSSVAAYLATPRLTARYGYRMTLAVGLAGLGAPALALALSANIAVIMAVCVVRGAGFALVCVAGGALTVSLIPPRRRGEGLALVGVVGGVPSVACLPLGIWLAGHVGYRPVFLAGGAAALAGLASVPWLPRSGRQPSGEGAAGAAAGILAGLRSPALIRPALTFSAVTMAIGIVVTFLPLALPRASGVAALALLIQPAAAIGGRWLAGRYGDRHGSAVLLAPGVLVAAAGLAALSVTDVPAAVITGGAVFGAGVGVTQNASQTLMYSRVPESGYGTAGAIWNLAYDGGMGLGAAWFGLAAARTGYPAAFALTAAVLPAVLAVLAVAGRRGRRTGESAAGRGHEIPEPGRGHEVPEPGRGHEVPEPGRGREMPEPAAVGGREMPELAAERGREMLEPGPGARTTARSV
jgi:predicted MFS family arabinose efflux permease